MTYRTSPTTADDKSLHADIADLISRHLNPDTKERVLAIAAQVVGQVLAMQNRITMPDKRALDIINLNIEAGYKGAISGLLITKGNA